MGVTSHVKVEKVVPEGDLRGVAASIVSNLHYASAQQNIGKDPVYTYVILPFNAPDVSKGPSATAERQRIIDQCKIDDFKPLKACSFSDLAMRVSAVESQIAVFLAKYTPAIEIQLRDARARLRAMFPRGFELVFDNYNALVFGISATERRSDAFISVVGYPKWVTLFFLNGADLQDPHGLLKGQGKQVRSVRLKEPADIDTPKVQSLIAQAIFPHTAALLAAPRLTTMIKLEVAKQRSRQPALAAETAKRSSIFQACRQAQITPLFDRVAAGFDRTNSRKATHEPGRADGPIRVCKSVPRWRRERLCDALAESLARRYSAEFANGL